MSKKTFPSIGAAKTRKAAAAFVFAALGSTNALADCFAAVSSSCVSDTACTTISGSYTNTTDRKIKEAEIIAKSGDDGKTLTAAIVLFTGTKATVYDPNSNTPPSGLSPGDTSLYAISAPFPLAALGSSLTCVVESVK